MSEAIRSSAGPVPDQPPPLRRDLRHRRTWLLIGLTACIAVGAQLIGPLTIPIGGTSIHVLPMLWGLLAGAIVAGNRRRPLGLDLQVAAGAVMAVGVLFLCARLAFTIGPNIGLLVAAGPALLLQEVGHLFGTIALALPLAVLLRMGPATVGATFSIDRESSFAMVSDRYGADSPQYRGVLSMYVFGTVFGTVLVSLIASMATSFGVFDPLALAMGAGVGSGSMMAAAAASVVAGHPELADQVLAVAATSNLLTGVLGIYVGMYIALPLADRVYRLLTRGRDSAVEPAGAPTTQDAPRPIPTVDVPLLTTLPIVFVVGVAVSSVAAKGFSLTIVGGYAVLTALVAIGIGISRLTRGKVASMIGVITLGALASSPISPLAQPLGALVGSIDFLSVCTVVLTVAGLSLGKDLKQLRGIGWKIVPVGLVAIAASYLLSVVVAEFALGLWH